MIELGLTDYYTLAFICIFGLCIGSFLNVVILRSLSGESIVLPPSKCPKCGNRLKPWHNIPVLSYLFLRGKCAFCNEKISLQYPIIELLTMILFTFAYIKFGFDIKTVFVMFWVACIIVMTVTDLKEKIVECHIAIIMGISGLVLGFINNGIQGGIESLLGLVVGVIIIEGIAKIGLLIAKTRAMGEADTYVAGAMGAIVGFHNIIPVLFYGLVASMVIILPMFWYNRYKVGDKITCILSVLFILSSLIFKTVVQNYWTFGAVAVTGIMLSWAILKGLEEEGNRNYIPYVPALAAGFLYYLFI